MAEGEYNADAHRRFNAIVAGSGVQWDYSGACPVCMHLTDTALGFRGSRAWLVGILVVLGIPPQEAENMFDYALGEGTLRAVSDPLMEAHEFYRPGDLYQWTLRLCWQCHARCPVEMPRPVLPRAGDGIPCHRGLLPPEDES